MLLFIKLVRHGIIFSVYHRVALSALLLAVGVLVAHVHPAGYAAAVLALGNQLVEGASGKEVTAETLERTQLPVDGNEVEGIAVAMRRGIRAAHRLVECGSPVAGRDVDAHLAQAVLPAMGFPRLAQRVDKRLYGLHDVRLDFGRRGVIYLPRRCRGGIDAFL